MDLADVQTAIRDINPYYPSMLDWRQDGDIIKAFPKHQLSERAFQLIKKVFKRLGGGFVHTRYEKYGYFELVLEENGSWQTHEISDNSPRGQNSVRSSAPGTALERIQARLISLVDAGRELAGGP